jgi:hypothetical protein
VKLAKKADTNGASLRFRRSYLALATKQRPHPSMNNLADDPFDATAIGLMAATAPDPSKPGVHLVQVRVDLHNLQFEQREGKWVAGFDLGLALEAGGNVPPPVSNKSMTLSLTDDQLKQGLAAGLLVDNSVPSPAKPSVLRVVVQDRANGQAGSVRLPIQP